MDGAHVSAGEEVGEHHSVEVGAGGEAGLAIAGDGGVEAAVRGLGGGAGAYFKAGEMAAEGAADGVGAAAVEVDSRASVGGEFEHVVGCPEGGGEGVAHAGLAASVAGVSFGHAVGQVSRAGGGHDARHVAADARVGAEQVGDVDVGIVGRSFGVVVAGAGGDVSGEVFGGFVGEANDPFCGGADVGSSELCVGYALEDGAGEGEPLGEVGVEVPGGRAERVVGLAVVVGFVADLEPGEAVAQGAGGVGGFFRGGIGSGGAEIEAVDDGPVGGVEEAGEVVDGFGMDGGVGVGHPVGGAVGVSGWRRRGLVGTGFPPAVFAGVASDAEDALRAEGAEDGDEIAVRGGEEFGVGEFDFLVTEASVIKRDGLRRGRAEGDGEWGFRGENAGRECGGGGCGEGGVEEAAARGAGRGHRHGLAGLNFRRGIAGVSGD